MAAASLILRRAFLGIVVFTAVLGIVFMALTHTEVGRETLRGEIERQFGRSFDGSIEIGRLSGNLLHDVFASDVRLTDRHGRLVATVDSLVYRPYWRSILDRRFSSGRLHLIRPDIVLTFDEDGPNIAAIFRREATSRNATDPWSFETADLRIQDGRLRTVNAGYQSDAVDRELIFDYSDADIANIQGRFRIDARHENVRLAIRTLRGDVQRPSAGAIEAQGMATISAATVDLDEFVLEAGATRFVANLAYGFAPGVTPHIGLDVSDADIDNDVLRVFFPLFPLADHAAITARIRGPLDALTVEELSYRRGDSSIRLSGSIEGLPDRADFQIAVDESRITFADARAVWPAHEWAELRRLGYADFAFSADGLLLPAPDGQFSYGSADGHLRVSSPAGTLDGPFSITRSDDHALLRTTLHGRDVQPDVLFTTVPAARLNGTLHADLSGKSLRELGGTSTVALDRSTFAGRIVDSLWADVTFDARRVGAIGSLRSGAGTAFANVDFRRDDIAPALRADARLRDFDAGPWLSLGDAATRLNAHLTLVGTGRSLDDLSGRIDASFDSSTVIHGQELVHVPPHTMHAEIRHVDAGMETRVWGDVFQATLLSDASVRYLAEAIAGWRPRLDEAIQVETRKLRTSHPDSTVVGPSQMGVRPFSASISGRLHRPEWAATLMPRLRDLQSNLTFEASLVGSADSLISESVISADSIIYAGLRALDASIAFDVRLGAAATWPEGIEATAHLRAGEIITAGEHFHEPRLTFMLDNGLGAFHAETRGNEEDERFVLAARLAVGHSYNSIILDNLSMTARGAEWSLESSQHILQYADALVVPRLEVTSQSVRTTELQRFWIDGALSAAEGDTLYAHLDHVRLGDLSDMFDLRDPLAGIMNGRIALAGVFSRPEITGDISVERLIFDGRPLGSLSIQSRYLPGRPDIALHARISPLPDSVGARPGEGIPVGPATNDLLLAGTFRLPIPGPDRRMLDPGMLDLRLTARSADAFFFDYIFRNVVAGTGGHLAGSGTIRGDFRRPLFDAQVNLAGGRVDVPAFNLSYTVEGNATIDAGGIRLHGVEVRDPTGGRAVVDGGILFNDYRYFSLDLRGRLHDSQFMNVMTSRDMAFYGDVRGSGTVTLTGPLHHAVLQSNDATISPESRIFIAILDESATSDPGYIVFANEDGSIPDLRTMQLRETLLTRPEGERVFVDGLEMDLNFAAAQGVTVHLVIDPVLGDVINATGNGRIQLQRIEGDYYTFGTFNVNSGDYLFTAGDVFVRRFLIDGGSISWDGQPNNASLDITASYRTRASPAGLNLPINSRSRIPLIVRLNISDRVVAPVVGLNLLVDRTERDAITRYESIEALLNQPDRAAEYATSVMLTNSFLLTTSLAAPGEGSLTSTRNQLAFTSLSQLVSSQLNRYLNYALPNLDVSVGFQGESTQDLDVTYGVALSLLDERLVIRGQGLYQNEAAQNVQQNLLDEFVVEVRLSNSVSVEVFYRREGDILGADQTLANTTGAGLSYETQFSTWSRLVDRLFGWMRRDDADTPDEGDVLAVETTSRSAD